MYYTLALSKCPDFLVQKNGADRLSFSSRGEKGKKASKPPPRPYDGQLTGRLLAIAIRQS